MNGLYKTTITFIKNIRSSGITYVVYYTVFTKYSDDGAIVHKEVRDIKFISNEVFKTILSPSGAFADKLRSIINKILITEVHSKKYPDNPHKRDEKDIAFYGKEGVLL